MTDKPEWMTDAACEIMSLVVQLSKKEIGKLSVDKIIATIEEHCPEDKAVEKLVEALIQVLMRQKAAWVLVYDSLSKYPMSSLSFLESIRPIDQINDALAEYEKVK